ncbi:pseudouridine synthase [Rhodoferax saidenbachensis]|uniref:Pseudouridine synthase n=1 Tax=Rhodoferax saidenbachensis TaxID=1484693 RepID=A0A1P8KB79_9BURK|nr:pseudouridine synthase [Rhodoferax saidenbachensis]APW43267.1 pseudouridine synthase [Rhodoferax saidenbachensis]
MRATRHHAPAPRNGVGASCVVVPAGVWPSVMDFLAHQFPRVAPGIWQQRLAQGSVSDDSGAVLSADTPCVPGQRLYYYREVEAEVPIPFEATVLWRNDDLLVADKPHFLPVMPSGKYVQETLLVRLKKEFDLPELTPIHRIDRDTAGLVLFSVRAATRNAYAALFRERQVTKHYECIAPWNPALPWPIHRATRIGNAQHFMQQSEEVGEVNAITDIEPIEVHGNWARYALKPITGQRHQLRVHMAALGLPLLGDGIYPVLTPEGTEDYNNPLQLLAQSIAFTDPLCEEPMQFESRLKLRALDAI